MIARLIDFGILVVVWIVIWIILAVVVLSDATTSADTVEDLNLGWNITTFVVSAGTWVLYWLYESLMASTRGQTIGKMIMKIRVTDRQGNLLSTGDAMKRSLVWLTPIVPCCIGWVAFLVIEIWGIVNIFNRPDRLTLMDQFADSTVTDA